MSYEQIEQVVQASLQELASIFGTNDAGDSAVTRGDFRVLDKVPPPCLVLVPGPFRSEPVGGFGRVGSRQQTNDTWMLDLYLYERYLGDGSEYVNIGLHRTAVIAKLRRTVMPGGKPLLVDVGGEIIEILDEDENGPFFLMQIIRCENVELAVS